MGGELAPGTIFAGHRIEAVAGRGGMGVVYRATQLGLDRTVALKVIAAGLLDDNTVRARFVRESKVAASIDHPNVVPIYYSGEEDGVAYIAMRYVAGDDVRSLVRRVGPLPPERAAGIVAQIGSALDAAHAAGLVHRDVKPANVLLADNDHVYLTDFGLTKHTLSVAGTTKPGHWVGTLDYLAPEQMRGERIDARADVYALGCLLYYALTGQVPYPREGDTARMYAHLTDEPPKPTRLEPDVPPAFDDVITRALAKDADDRYQSAGDLGRAALAAASGAAPAEGERLVAKGAAAPIESPTLSAAARPTISLQTDHTQVQPEDETVALTRSRHPRARSSALLGAALVLAAAIGVVAAVALGVGDDTTTPTPTPSASKTPTATPTATAAAAMEAQKPITVGNRPNVVRAVGDNIFVGSFRDDRMAIVDRKTGKIEKYHPRIGIGSADAAYGFGSLWVAVNRARQIVRLDPKSGRPRGKPISVPGMPNSIAIGRGAVFVGLLTGGGAPDKLIKLDPKSGQPVYGVDYPYGISSLAVSPSALWVANRRRAWIQRVDTGTGKPTKEQRVGQSHAEDAVYHAGALWLATPEDDTVYKVITKTGDRIPISVGRFPRQIAIGGGNVYVTNYNSSQLFRIDEKSSQIVGDPLTLPVNPFSLGYDASGDVWVGSPPENQLSKVTATGPAG